MINCNVKSFVYYEHQPGEYVLQHEHNCFECVFYIKGKGNITVDNEMCSYDKPTITILKPGISHDEKTEEFTQLYILLFEVNNPSIFNKPFTKLELEAEEVDGFLKYFKLMQDEEKNKAPFYNEMMNSLFGVILSSFIRNTSSTNIETNNKELVNRVKNYIKENYSQKIDFNRIAASFGYSYSRFRHIFADEVNQSLGQYLLNCRLYAAKQMLLNTNNSIKVIAKACGFKSAVHFNNFFTEKMGVSPLKFRHSQAKPINVGVLQLASKSKKTIFLDTDIGGDCDDAGAIALLNIFKNQGDIDICGMCHCTSLPYGPGVIDAINTYYGNDILIGATKRKDFLLDNTNKFASKVCEAYPHRYDNKEDVLESTSFIRKQLSLASDNSVTFLCIGQLNDVSDLLDSTADEYSSLNGIELVKKKVNKFVIMGGLFKDNNQKVLFEGYEYSSEYNIVCDIKSAQNFILKVPVKVVFSDFLVGNEILTGKTLLEQCKDNPVTLAYQLFQNKPRYSWDLLATWYAVNGKDDIFTISDNGTIKILDDGTTIFDNTQSSNHYYLRLKEEKEYIENKIDEFLLGGNINENNN